MNREIRSLTGLLVVIGHYSAWAAVTPMAEVPTWIRALANAAPGIGMSIFFTLSGYVIALSYSHWDWRAQPGLNLARLFFYRFARLYPAFFVFALLIVMRTPALHDLSDPAVRADIAVHVLLLQSWLPVKYGGALVSGDWFHVSWSLSTECALYLLFGLGAILAASLPSWRRKATTLAVAFFATATVLLTAAWIFRQSLLPAGWTDGDWLLWLFAFSPWMMSVEFAIGVVAWRLSGPATPEGVGRMASELGGVGFVIVYVLCFVSVIYHPVDLGLAMAFSTALAMVGARSSSVVNWLLTRPTLLYVGTISYSLYLFHFIAPAAFSGTLETFTGVAAASYASNFLFKLAFAIALATGLYRLVEVPGRRVVRAAADRWLGLAPAPIVDAQGAPAE